MRLDRLLGDLEVLEWRGEPASVEVASVAHDSRAVRPGALFCCLRGASFDGHDFAPAAVEAGAVALLCERLLPVGVVQARVADARVAMAPAAAAAAGHPSRRLEVVGITGTNGKTTTAELLAAVLRAAGRPTGVIGTLTGPRTTPEAPDLQAALAAQLAAGARAVALEVSSDALVQHRVDATWFGAVAFTNLSPEHLNTHGDMESYFGAKASLFDPGRAPLGVVNADDAWGRRLLDAAPLPAMVPYSLAAAEGLELGPFGARFAWEGRPVALRLGGRFNVSNALCAATVARELGVAAEAVAEGLSSFAGVPGRFERVAAGQPFAVVVDYAHTPAALEQVLEAARAEAGEGRVLVVFGCGGERDRAKRPLMGAAAARLADVVVLTSDNPRGEDPGAILDEVRAGAAGARSLVVEPDRRAAIAGAIAGAAPGDVVVVAGKGHEAGQTAGGRTEPFDDRRVARAALAAAGHTGAPAPTVAS
ncbi:MAG TPA: UDP-N-acetylmuramoyl-L-alanyl-D-glutamate--2,6-diaminopimelate ligase [Acidimicrobiales bacterium]|nr:UDP-N-acetylmuramoyl-L-alanyl-D-glutamate--2,6-diaminopimelate ligase [Acidimicrobiales bacterium]